ncbi:MAG: hypothetical protein ACTHJ3_07195 [Pararhizobium sp.]
MEYLSSDLRLNGVLDRLERVLANENRDIGSDPHFDVRASNIQKSRCLYELTQLSRSVGRGDLTERSARRLDDVRAMLAANEKKLRAHVEAVRSVAGLIKEAMQAAEADGTYTADQFRRRDPA